MTWRDYADVTVEIASLSGLPGASGSDAAYWQPDGHGTLWQPEGAVSGAPGFGEWVEGFISEPHKDWETLPWFSVECDMSVIETSTGFSPGEWNASPGSLSVTLWDAFIQYTPIGPTGLLDDIGIDTPIRIKVTGKGLPWSAQYPYTIIWAGLIRRVAHRHTPDGTHITTINAAEMIEVYGRTNPVALASPVPSQNLDDRTKWIHDRSDKPNGFPYPDTTSATAGAQFAPDDLHDNVWQEMCAVINAAGSVAAQTLYPWLIYQPDATPPNIGSPRATALNPVRAPNNLPNQYPTYIQVRPYCSVPIGDESALQYSAIAPGELAITHSLEGVANDIDLAIAGWDGSAKDYIDQPSVDRWGRHTYTRHDLKLTQSATARDALGAAILKRSAQAVYSVDALEFPVTTPRDLSALVGVPAYVYDSGLGGYYRVNNKICQPGEVWLLIWREPKIECYLALTSVAHSIDRDNWKVTIAAEMQCVNTMPGPIQPIPPYSHSRTMELV